MRKIASIKTQNGLATLVTSVFLSAGLLLATAKITQERSQSANALKQDLKIEFADSLEQSLQHYVDAYFKQRENIADLVKSDNMLETNCSTIETLSSPGQKIMRFPQSSPFTANRSVVEYQVEGLTTLPEVCGTQLQSFIEDVKANPQTPRLMARGKDSGLVELVGDTPRPVINGAPGYIKNKLASITNIYNTNEFRQENQVLLSKIIEGNEPVQGRFLLKAAVDCDKTDTSKADTCITRSRYLWLRQ